MNRIWYKFQERTEKRLAQSAIRRLKSLPDGVEMSWSVLFWGEVNSYSAFILRHSFLYLKNMFVIDRIRLIDWFEGMAVKEGYIIDKSNYVGAIGGPSEPIFRIRENLLNIFAKIHETKISSENSPNGYYFKEFFEKRNGKNKPIQLYRIPYNSTTGRIRIQPQILWISAIPLNGNCIARRGVVTDDKERFDFGDDDWVLKENEEYTFDNNFKNADTGEYSWFELKNAEAQDLLMLVFPIDENVI